MHIMKLQCLLASLHFFSIFLNKSLLTKFFPFFAHVVGFSAFLFHRCILDVEARQNLTILLVYSQYHEVTCGQEQEEPQLTTQTQNWCSMM